MILALAMSVALMAPPTPEQCFAGARDHYNMNISSKASAKAFEQDYEAFADCAGIALAAQAWPEYFASTVGAAYSQTQMAGLTKVPEKCKHYSLALDLLAQAEDTGSQEAPPEIQSAVTDAFDPIIHDIKKQESKSGCK